MTRRWILAGLLLTGLTLTGLHAQPEDGIVTLRFDSLKTVVGGSVANPFKIELEPDEVLTVGKPVYIHASFKNPGTDRKKKEPDQRKVRQVLQADRVQLSLAIPHRDPDEKPIRVLGWIRPDFCCGKGLDGSFTVPESAALGEVTLRISWATTGNLRGGHALVDVTLK